MIKKSSLSELFAILASFLMLIIGIAELFISIFLFTESYVFSNIQYVPHFFRELFYLAHAIVPFPILFGGSFLIMGIGLLCLFISNMVKFAKNITATRTNYTLSKFFSIASFALLIASIVCSFLGLVKYGILAVIAFGLLFFLLFLAHIFTIVFLFCIEL